MLPFADAKSRRLLQIFNAVGEGANEFCAITESYEKELVLRIGTSEKLQGGFLGLGDLVGHAAAEIENEADGNGNVYRRGILNFLLDVVFEDAEVIRGATRDQVVMPIGDRNVDEHQIHIDVQGSLSPNLFQLLLPLLLLRILAQVFACASRSGP